MQSQYPYAGRRMQRRLAVKDLQTDFAIELVNLRAAMRAQRLAGLKMLTQSAGPRPSLRSYSKMRAAAGTEVAPLDSTSTSG
jgi:hypothetical protein